MDNHCSSCVRNPDYPRHYCSMHLEGQRRRRKKFKEAKCCIDCKNPASKGILQCEEHARKNAIRQSLRKYGRPPKRLTRWNPNAGVQVLKYLSKAEVYLNQDWGIVKPFVLQNYQLWLPKLSTTWRKTVLFSDLCKKEQKQLGLIPTQDENIY